MKKSVISIVVCLLMPGFIACAKVGADPEIEKPQPPVTPPIESEAVLKGSFESKFVRYSKGQKFAGESDNAYVSTVWRDTVWMNDRIHKQLVLWVPEGRCDGITCEVTNLEGENTSIPASSFQLRFLAYVIGDREAAVCEYYETHAPAYVADALSEQPFSSVNSDEPRKIWLTVHIPANTRPGHYRGKVKIKSDNRELLSFDMEFLVVNHLLPEPSQWKFHLDIWQFPFQLAALCTDGGAKIEPFSERYFNLIEPFYRMLADAGQKAVTTYIKDGAFQPGKTMVKWKQDEKGNWQFDYTNFDTFVEKMEQWGICKQINCFSLVGWNKSIGYEDAAGTAKTLEPAIGSELYRKIWTAFLDSFKAHLLQKNWFDKAVLYMDEIKEEEMRAVIDMIKGHDPQWKIGLSGSNISPDIEDRLYDYSPILGCEHQTRTAIATFYTSCSQKHPNNYVTLDNSPAEMTWMAWYAKGKGLDGYLRWAYDFWTLQDPLNVQDGANTAGDFNMVYRTGNNASDCKPVSSIRFELLREGIQDYEKIRILGESRLRNMLAKFTESTGENAEKLVLEAETLLKKVSVEP